MKFFDLHVHTAFSEGESSIEEMVEMARRLGYSGICLCFYFEDEKQMEIITAEVGSLRERSKIKVLLGFDARNKHELRFLRRRRRSFDILLVRGGNEKLNRKACETTEVDILTHPEYKRNDSGLNHISMKYAAKNKVAIEINFREIMMTSKGSRSTVLSNIRKNIELAKKYGANLILCSGALNKWELRPPECMISMATLLGMELKDAKNSISGVPKSIIELSEEGKNEKWVMPGVRIL